MWVSHGRLSNLTVDEGGGPDWFGRLILVLLLLALMAYL